MKKSKKIIVIISIIAVLMYIITTVYMLITHPTDTYIIRQETLEEKEETTGYIIRDEEVIKGEDYQNGIYAIASEGQRVAKGESVFRYYSDSEKEIKTQISALNYKIQELLQQEKITPTADIKAIEKQIEEKIQISNKLTNYQEIIENKKDIDNLITKKINFIGDATKNKEIKTLVNERNAYEQQLKSGSEYQKATMGGVVSYRVDGLEDELTLDKFDQITEKYLNSLELKTGKIISTSNECGKIIDNFKCYIAITMNSKQAQQAEVGKKVDLRISTEEQYKAKIIQINEESGKRTIIFETDKMTESLISHRKVDIDVIWWSETGLKIPKQALTQENGKYYVTRNKAGIQTKLLVNVKAQTDKFAIIASYNKDELKELGYTTKEITSYNNSKISNYDEIIINL